MMAGPAISRDVQATCWALEEANTALLQQIIQCLHEVLLDGVGLIGEGWKVLSRLACTMSIHHR